MNLDKLKESNQCPVWYTEEGFKTVNKGYLLENETPIGMYQRVASATAKSGKFSKDIEDDFYETMINGWLGPASPILSNMGTDRGLPISCFLVNIQDNLYDIMGRGLGELAMLSKYGGGVGVSFQNIRPSGSLIKGGKNGKSSGIIPFAKAYDSAVLASKQGEVRRGSASINLSIEHADFDDFIKMRRPEGDVNRQCLNLHHCVTISDEFMSRVKNGDKEAKERWTKVMKARIETGEPYILYEGNVERGNPEAYKQNGLKVNATNICCLTGETLVLTSEGPKRIDSLVGQSVHILDGDKWVECDSFEKKGIVDEVYEITFDNTLKVRCTKNHRWFIYSKGSLAEVLAENLNVGDQVENTYGLKTFISNIELIKGKFEVYCPTVESTGKFVLTYGVVTGNSEIVLYSDGDHSFTCCLSSLNLAKYNEWKNWKSPRTGMTLPQIGVYFLEGVLEDFITRASYIESFERTIRATVKGRAIGLGVMGWHTYLQQNMIPFESFQAMTLNNEITRFLKNESDIASKKLAEERGEPEWCVGTGFRHSHRLAYAPTKSNSIICGDVSASIEPITANAYTDVTAKGNFIRRSKLLSDLLIKKGKNTDELWKDISNKFGSVQHLDFLTDHEKAVFKTAYEIDQKVIVQQAAQRTPLICQSQSINLFFPFDVKPFYFNSTHLLAYDLGVKTLYYCKSTSGLKIDIDNNDCKACEA